MDFLKDIREDLELSYKSFAEKVGSTHTTIWNCENKPCPILENFLKLLCNTRKLSKKSWAALGQKIEEEFGD